jgi:hypothetical protein
MDGHPILTCMTGDLAVVFTAQLVTVQQNASELQAPLNVSTHTAIGPIIKMVSHWRKLMSCQHINVDDKSPMSEAVKWRKS